VLIKNDEISSAQRAVGTITCIQVKLNAIEAAFGRCKEDVSRFDFIAVPSDSGVPAQPFGDEETLAGWGLVLCTHA